MATRSILVFLFFITTTSLLFAQTATGVIRRTVQDRTRAILINVHVWIKKSAQVFVLVFACFCASVVFAQQPFGTIVGTVTDTTGAVLPAVKVTVTNTATQVKQVVVTSAFGDYAVPYLVNGIYTIKVEHPGFQPSMMSDVALQAAQILRADIRMQVGPAKEFAEASAITTALQTDTAVVGTTIDAKAVNELPLNGRTFAQLATLVPGVAPQGATNIATSRKRGSIGTAFAFTANGFSDVQNNFLYDGVPAMDLDSYNFAFSPSIDAIAEFQVQTNSYSSAYGGECHSGAKAGLLIGHRRLVTNRFYLLVV